MGINISSNYIPAININTGISVSGILSVSSNSFYDVTNYQSLIIENENADLLESRLLSPTTFSDYDNQSAIKKISPYTFWSTKISSVDFPFCTYIDMGAFYSCSSLLTANFPQCLDIGSSAFNGCYSLSQISFPACKSINGYGPFYYCSSLTSVDFPACMKIFNYTFASCSNLSTANFPVCVSTGVGVFYRCSSLESVNFPHCEYLGNFAFSSCSRLTSVNFPACTYIGSSAFYSCYSLSTASFPACTSIGTSAFYRCYNLLSLYLLGSSLCSLAGTGVFISTPISNYTTSTGGVYGSIYVPSSLYNSYIAATNWVTYSSRFVSV